MFKKLFFLCLLQTNFTAYALEQAVADEPTEVQHAVEQGTAQQQLDVFLNNTQSLSARFQQKLVDQYGFLLQQSAGTLKMQRPGKFRWDYILPYPQKIVSNGKKIWMYDSELEQVNVRPYDQLLASSPVNLLDKNQPLEENFTIKKMPADATQSWVKLLPKNTESDFKEMLVGLQNGNIKTMRFVDNFNQQTEIEFEQLVVNPILEAKLFEFIAPLGTDVMGDF